jgi:acyl-CoA hydrolase
MGTRPLKRMADSRTYLAEIVGEEQLQGQRMHAGAILDLMDVVAGRAAFGHAGGPVVTLSFDRVDLVHPIFHLDLVRLDAYVAHVGRSSIMVCVEVSRQDVYTREFMPIQRSFVTMVAIDAQRRSNPDIPGLALESDEERALNAEALAHRELAARWVEMQEQARARGALSAAEVEDPINREKRDFVTPAETVVRVQRVFMPRHLNVLGTIFGGDILLWMDRVATYASRLFTRNRFGVTLAMNRIIFRQPIYATDLVEMTARVVYVRRYTLEVEIEVTLQRGGQSIPSHSGHFTVLNYDESGFKRPILTGLRLDPDDPDALLRYHLARERHRFWREQQAAHGPGGSLPHP